MALPRAQYLDPESSTLLGIVRGEPTSRPIAETSPTAPTLASTGQAAWRRRLSPRHKAAVQQFFSER